MIYDTKINNRNIWLSIFLGLILFIVSSVAFKVSVAIIISYMYILTCIILEYGRINRNIIIKEMQLLKLNLECDKKCLETKRKKTL